MRGTFWLILGTHLLIALLELPELVRRRLHRQWWVLTTLLVLNMSTGILLMVGWRMLGPVDLIMALFEPLGRMLGK